MEVVQEAVARLGDHPVDREVVKTVMVETREVDQVEVLRGRPAEMGRLAGMGRLTVLVQTEDKARMKDLLATQRGTYLSTL